MSQIIPKIRSLNQHTFYIIVTIEQKDWLGVSLGSGSPMDWNWVVCLAYTPLEVQQVQEYH